MPFIHQVGAGFGVGSGGALTAPTLAVADSANGTGGVATLTGGDAGATNEIFVQAVDLELGTSTWTSKGSRTGAGTVTIAANPGIYWVKCVSTLGSSSNVSNLVYVVFTTGASAILEQCLTTVKAAIQGFSLAGMSNANVVIQKRPSDGKKDLPATQFPCILVAPFGRETMDPIGNSGVNKDDVGYPILVGIIAADNQDQDANRNQYFLWRETIRRQFNSQRLTDLCMTVKVEPLEIVDGEAWFKRNKFVSGLVLRCISRETRL